MLNYVLGKKIGMSQIFDNDRNAVPVTVIDVGRWIVTQLKTEEVDGYSSLQLGLLRKRYSDDSFNAAWLKSKKKFLEHISEIPATPEDLSSLSLGQDVGVSATSIADGDSVKVSGISKGKGFQGVTKRWNFSLGPKSHGSTFHRSPGSIGNLCSVGKVIKGKKLPGHMGNKRITVKGLKVVRVDPDNGCLFLRGAVPGSKHGFLTIGKQGA